MGDNIVPKQYDKVAEYIFYMMISSVIGFSLAHKFKSPPIINNVIDYRIPLETIDAILNKFRWLLLACLIIGILQVAFIVSIGGFESLDDVFEFFTAGAEAVQVGTANFTHPETAEKLVKELEEYINKNGLESLDELNKELRA